MENVFNTNQFSTKLSDQDQQALNEAIFKINPDFVGTKTDAFKAILSDYLKCKSETDKLKSDIEQLSENYNIAVSEFGEKLELVAKELEERKKFIEEMESPADNIGFSDEDLKRYKILAYLAVKEKFIEENSIPELVNKILTHYQSQGYFLPEPEELEAAKKELGLI